MIDSNIKKILSSKKSKHEKLSKVLKYLFVKIAGISQDKYFILGSYALREHRHINDLDINLDVNEFLKLNKVVEKGFGHIEFYNNQIRWFFDFTKEYNKINKTKEDDVSIEAFQKFPEVGFPTSKFSLKKLRRARGFERDNNNHQYFSLKTLLAWKKKMNRPKDQKDIELIKSILN